MIKLHQKEETSMKELNVDLVVIGSGPAGQKGAIQAAKEGFKVVVVDKNKPFGGACLHQGTIPSKTLREATVDLTGFLERSYYGQEANTCQHISIDDLTYRLDKVILDQEALLQEQFKKNNIEMIHGCASFKTDKLIYVRDYNEEISYVLNTRRTLIATGSRPRRPKNVPFDETTILESDALLRLTSVPKSMMVLGGGVIGSEYATMFAALGTKVTLIDKAPRPLMLLDIGVNEHFIEYIEEMGVEIKMEQNIIDIRKSSEGKAQVALEGGEVLEADCLFYALGRVPNVESLNLEAAGVTVDDRGRIIVNKLFQTQIKSVYGAGDVIGDPALASTSMEQGRLAVRNAFSMKTKPFPEFVPYGIYTIPEISMIGPTEEQLKEKNVKYEVGRAYYYEIGRGPIAGDTTGMIKLIFHADTREMLATHIIGSGATELIHIGQLAIDFHARVDYFINQIFNYPTFAEGYRIAALNGINKLPSQDD